MTRPSLPVGFWTFSLDVYARPGVAELCLDLQDRFGLDVNLLLWAAWAGFQRGIVLSPDDIQKARAAVADWNREIVIPLRTLRRRLKSGPPPAPSPATGNLRDGIKALELEAERLEQEVLSGLPLTGPSARPDPALAANLFALVPDPEAAPILDRLIAAIRRRN